MRPSNPSGAPFDSTAEFLSFAASDDVAVAGAVLNFVAAN